MNRIVAALNPARWFIRHGKTAMRCFAATKAKLTFDLSFQLRVGGEVEAFLIDAPEVLRKYYSKVERFVLFASLARTGHSLMAHLLSAHPDVVVSDELNAGGMLAQGLSREQVLALVKYQDYRYAHRQRVKSGYSYLVEGTWQNEFEKYPVVMGDAKGGRTTQLISHDAEFLPLVRERMGIPLKVIVHLRNPFDMLSTRAFRKERGAMHIVQRFGPKMRAVETAWHRLQDAERLLQRHEDVIRDPKYYLTRMFEFLEVEPIPKVVDACAQRIWQKPQTRRKEVEWGPAATRELNELLAGSELFSSYVE